MPKENRVMTAEGGKCLIIVHSYQRLYLVINEVQFAARYYKSFDRGPACFGWNKW